MGTIEKWLRYICAILFLATGIYMGIHTLHHDHEHHHHGCECVEHHV